MPNQVVTLHRWQVVGAFLVMVAIAVAVAVWNDHRIDLAEKRITKNTARAEDLRRANERQDKLRAQLLQGLLHTDTVACLRIEALKAQNRLNARQNFAMLERNLGLIGIKVTPEILAAAEQGLARALERNRPIQCNG